ncbi:AmmeMemoRadiSam system radical SAM enzyme [Candidatus Woesearchaeota archaeon]|nr:MAG: AmmeMemoRadiSam system radical SAM enzyme [Candidatus Woesearchaeota archaeon]
MATTTAPAENPLAGKKATLYEPFEKGVPGTVRCKACAQRCIIQPSKRGVCAIRENRNGTLYLTTYGKAVGLHPDPIEKKPLFHFLPGTRALSFGTVGCNFRCAFCQNHDMSQASKDGIFFGEDAQPEAIVALAKKLGCHSIAYTYNEPAIFIEYAHDTARAAKRAGLHNVFVSNGYETAESFEYIKPYLDAINIDLKAFNDDFYRRLCGARLAPVLESIKRVAATTVWVEITTLIIPGENDQEEELRRIAGFIAGIGKHIPWHISRFFPHYRMQQTPPTPLETLERAYHIGKEAGLHYVYVGNVHDPAKQHTYCPRCGELLIERDGMDATTVHLTKPVCPSCKETIHVILP